MAGKNVTIKIDSDTKGAESGLNKISKELNSFANNVKKGPLDNAAKLGAAVTGVGTAFSAVTGAIKTASAAIHECTEAYKAQATAERQLEVAAKNNPYLNSTSVTNLKNYATQLQKITTYGDEELLPMMAQLAASGRTEEQTMQIMSAAVDLAASGTMSLDSAVTNLNRTLNGTAGTLGKTNSKIKSLTEDELKNGEAVKIIAEQYKGMAEETAKATGSSQQLKNAWGDFKETLGAGFNAIISPIQKGITGILNGINSSISGFKTLIQDAKNYKKVMAGDTAGMDSATIEIAKKTASIKAESTRAMTMAALSDVNELISDYRTAADWEGTGFSSRLDLFNQMNAAAENLVKGQKAKNFGNKIIDDYVNLLAEQKKAQEEENKAIKAHAEAIRKETQAAKELAAEEWRAEVEAALNNANNTVSKVDAKKATDAAIGKTWTDAEYAEKMASAYYEAYNAMLDQSSDWNKMQNEAAVKEFLAKVTEWTNKANSYGKTVSTASTSQKNEKTAQDLVNELMQSVDQIFRDAENNQDITGEVMDLEKVWQKQSDTIVNGVVDILSKYQDLKFSDEIFDQVADKLTDIGNKLDLKASEKDKQAKYDALMARLGDAIGEKSLPLSKELKERKKDLEKFAEETMALYAEGSDERIAIEEKTAEALKAIDKDITQAKREEWDERLSIAQDYMNRFTEISNYLVDLTLKANEAESKARLAALEDEYDQGLVSETEFEEKRDQIQKEAAQESYKMELWQWGVQVAQIGVDTAKAIMSAISTSGNIYAGIAMATLVGAMGAAQLGAAIANKPKAPSFEAGGIVPGTSWSGDNVQANVNSGEMVLTRGQQARLWNMLGGGGSSGTKVSINNYLGRNARIQTQSSKNGLTIDVLDSHINKTMADGGYDTGFAGRDVARQGVVLV